MAETGASGPTGGSRGFGAAGQETRLNRTLGFPSLLVYGMVFMVPIAPMGIYGFVAEPALGMVPLVYLVGIAAMFFTAFSYRNMSREFTSSGSVYSYVTQGFGPHIGFLAGWLILADYLLVPALLYGFTGIWLNALAPFIPVWVFIIFFAAINTSITARGITITNRANFVLLAIELVALALFVAFAINYVFVQGNGAGGFSLDPLFQAENVNLGFISTAASIAVLSFLGFDGISTLAEETREPERAIGNATIAALLLLGTIFIFQTYLAALVRPGYAGLDPDLAFFQIGREAGGAFMYYMLLVVNVIAVGIANALAAQVAVSRIIYSVSRDRLLPFSGLLARLHPRFRTPFNATLIIGAITLVVALLFETATITRFVNFGALTAFMALNLSVIAYFFFRRGLRDRNGLIFYFVFPTLGFLIILFVWRGFDAGTFTFGLIWLAAGVVIGAVKSRFYTRTPATLREL